MRRRERAKHKTTLRVCHVKEVWEASADPQPILAEGKQAAVCSTGVVSADILQNVLFLSMGVIP